MKHAFSSDFVYTCYCATPFDVSIQPIASIFLFKGALVSSVSFIFIIVIECETIVFRKITVDCL